MRICGFWLSNGLRKVFSTRERALPIGGGESRHANKAAPSVELYMIFIVGKFLDMRRTERAVSSSYFMLTFRNRLMMSKMLMYIRTCTHTTPGSSEGPGPPPPNFRQKRQTKFPSLPHHPGRFTTFNIQERE